MKIAAIDQYGRTTFVDADKPRKSLADALGIPSSSLQKMYYDKADGSVEHIGYAGLGLWYTLHTLAPWTGGRA